MENQWIVEINNEVERLLDPSQESAHWERRSINRIPESVTYLNWQAYKPRIISFGPYHHGEERLKPMEEHKRRALLHFLKRSNKPLQSFLDALTPVVEDLRGAYEQLDGKWQDDGPFLKMMIMDGCFILEILRVMNLDPDKNDYAINDPIFNHGMQYILPILRRDMLMLENQLPIVVLVKLVSIQKDVYIKSNTERVILQDHTALVGFILQFFRRLRLDKFVPQFDECLHILEIYRKSLLLVQLKFTDKVAVSLCFRLHICLGLAGSGIIRSATELNEAGIRIEPNRSGSLTDISFRSGVLKLHRIMVDDALETFYLNLIAFERFHAGSEVTSYISFMGSIIRSARDVRLLQSCGVIRNALGSDEDVVRLFHSLSKDITLSPNSDLGMVLEMVNDYCERPWNRLRARIVHTYFTNPWAFISFIGSIFLFALTIIQTVYSVLH